jgi:hypothetical protein
MRTALAAIALGMLAAAPLRPIQERATPPLYIAFRFDADRVIATLKVLEDSGVGQVRHGLSAAPIARFGYQYFEPPEALLRHVPAGLRTGMRWVVHLASGQQAEAVAERYVGGNPACSDAVGVLLRVESAPDRPFSAHRGRYFIASPGGRGVARPDTSQIAALPAAAVSVANRAAVTRILDDLLVNELPRVRAEAEDEVERMAASTVDYHKSWARERRQIDEGLAGGRGRLSYDVQPFRLGPGTAPLYFVRAIWRVEGRPGFAAAVWLRGEGMLEVVRLDLRPASWLRMFEFQGEISNDQLGMVLNVFDIDQDGWGEVLFAQGGYESMGLELREYSADWFQSMGVGYSFGC